MGHFFIWIQIKYTYHGFAKQNTVPEKEKAVKRKNGVRTPPPPPLENRKAIIGFLSNTGPDPLEITKLPNQHSMLGHHRPASEMPFQWRFAGSPMVARF